MTIKALEVQDCLDYDRRRGFSLWLIARFPIAPCQITANKRREITEATKAAYVEEHGEEPSLIQNIEGSVWWRAGPVEGAGS